MRRSPPGTRIGRRGIEDPLREHPWCRIRPAYQRIREHLIYRRAAVRPSSLAEIVAEIWK